MKKFIGKYRGKVKDNADPDGRGRIKVSVPSVLSSVEENWALPCAPYAGRGEGLFTLPPVDANVWVEFEDGESSRPIWSGCYWEEGEVPTDQPKEHIKILKTKGVTLKIDDTENGGGLTILVEPPLVSTECKLVMDSSGIELSNGTSKIKISATSVNINEGALEVI